MRNQREIQIIKSKDEVTKKEIQTLKSKDEVTKKENKI